MFALARDPAYWPSPEGNCAAPISTTVEVMRKGFFIFRRYGSSELVDRFFSKARKIWRVAAEVFSRSLVCKKRARLLHVQPGSVTCRPRADAAIRIVLYIHNACDAGYTSLLRLCELNVPVTVIDDASRDGTPAMLAAAGQGYDVVTHAHELGFAASIARTAASVREPLPVGVAAGFVHMPGWLHALEAALQDETIAVASLIFNARHQPLTLNGDPRDSAFRFLRPLAKAPVAGSLMRRDAAAQLRPEQMQLESAVGKLLFEPDAVAIDLAPAFHYPVVEMTAGRTVAFFDAHAPYYDREGGGHRMWHLLNIARSGGWHVVFVPLDGTVPEPYRTQLERAGIEVLVNSIRQNVKRAVRARAREFDVAWMSRPEVFAAFAPGIRAANPRAALVYDTVDLHHVRLKRAAELAGSRGSWRGMREFELDLARRADVSVTVSQEEKAILTEAGARNVFVIPTLHDAVNKETPPFEAREGVLFIGGYDHDPNVDAARHLSQKILPLVMDSLPGIRLTLLGSNPPPKIRKLASASVRVPGYVADVAPFFERARVFAAPLRYGAGMKAKLTQAFAYGLPAVTTPRGAEGIADRSGLLVAEEDDDFAAAVVSTYNDPALWQRLSSAGKTASRAYDPARVSGDVLALLSTCALESARSSPERSAFPTIPR